MKKFVIVLGDGMPDYKIGALDDRTPLAAARTPNLDRLAPRSRVGMVRTVPPGFPPGSDVANLSVMGYDPSLYYSGRSPLEAVSMGVELGEGDVALRCNLVTLSGPPGDFASKGMLDYSAGEISSPEAAALVEEVHRRLGGEDLAFYAGVSYRHLVVWKGGPEPGEMGLVPPHDISGQPVGAYLPRGPGGERLRRLMEESHRFLPRLPVNLARKEKGLREANCLWFWGQGKRPALEPFRDKYGLEGSVISAVDLVKGIGLCAGLRAVEVPGATGNIHTDFAGKARAALKELESGRDYVYLHVEAPDEAGHQGDLATKVKAIEEIDQKVIGTLLEGLAGYEGYRLMVLADHPTPLKTRTHTPEPVPFLIYDPGSARDDGPASYHEEAAQKTGLFFDSGTRLLEYFLKEK